MAQMYSNLLNTESNYVDIKKNWQRYAQPNYIFDKSHAEKKKLKQKHYHTKLAEREKWTTQFNSYFLY